MDGARISMTGHVTGHSKDHHHTSASMTDETSEQNGRLLLNASSSRDVDHDDVEVKLTEDEQDGGGGGEMRNNNVNTGDVDEQGNLPVEDDGRNEEIENIEEQPIGDGSEPMLLKGDNDSYEEDDEDDWKLPETGYSIIFTAPIASFAYWAAVGIAVLQFCLLIFALFDLCDWDRDDNFFRIPPGISGFLRAAQVLGIILIAMTVTVQGDFRTGLLWLTDGYDPSIQEQHPHHGYTGWLLAGILQILVGIAFVCLALLLLLQSTDIIGMVLNFAATEFLSLIDELFFLLCAKRFLGTELQQACLHVRASHMPKKNHHGAYRRPLFFCTMLVALFIPAGFVWSGQLSGDYVCDSLTLRIEGIPFGSAKQTVNTTLVEGLFRQVEESVFFQKRAVYENSKDDLWLTYCRNRKRWIILERDQTCDAEDFVAGSIETESYEVESLSRDPWLIWHPGFSEHVPTVNVIIWCTDCDINSKHCEILESL